MPWHSSVPTTPSLFYARPVDLHDLAVGKIGLFHQSASTDGWRGGSGQLPAEKSTGLGWARQSLESSFPSDLPAGAWQVTLISAPPKGKAVKAIPRGNPAGPAIHLNPFPWAECPPLSGNQTKILQGLKVREPVIQADLSRGEAG